MARAPGFELVAAPTTSQKWPGRQDSNLGNGGSKDRCLTAWLRPIIISLQHRKHVAIISCCKGIDKMLTPCGILQTLLSEFRGPVIPIRWIVRPVLNDKRNFMAIHLAVVCGVRELQEYFFSDGEVLPLLSRKVLFDEPTVGTSKVVEGVGEVLANVDFAVRIADLVNDLHYRLFSTKLFFLISPDFSLLHKLLKIIDTDTKDVPKTICAQRSFADIGTYGFFF